MAFKASMGAKNIGVIVMRPSTGEIIAMDGGDRYDLNNPRDMSQVYSQIIFLKPDSLYICTFFQFFLGKTAVLTRGSIFFKCFLLIHCYLFFEDLVLAGACRRMWEHSRL